MDYALSNAEMREADKFTIDSCGILGGQLMQIAGNVLADEAEKAAKLLKADEITVVCGIGNNGGDGYVAAKILYERGYSVYIFAVNGELSQECKLAKELCKCQYTQHIRGAIVLDCVFGTGLCRTVTSKYACIIKQINDSGAYVISADIPSGLNGDNGLAMGCAVKADLTVAIGEYKRGMFLNDGLDLCGKIVKKDIGIKLPRSDYLYTVDGIQAASCFPKRLRNTHKGSYGTANIIAGSSKYFGAAALAVNAALQSGCGFVKLTSNQNVINALAPSFPQAIYLDEPELSANSIAVGMGTGIGLNLYNIIKRLLKEYSGNLIIDADGLNTISEFGTDILKNKSCNVILTPHIKEFSRLAGISAEEVLNNPVDAAMSFAEKYDVTLVLKSASTVICSRGSAALNISGNSALAKGGSGDILSGFMCGTLARGVSPFEAAKSAAYVLGKAAEISSSQKTEYCATASDILKNLHIAVRRLTDKNLSDKISNVERE